MAISSVPPGSVPPASLPASKVSGASATPPSKLTGLFSAIQSIGIDIKAATIFLNMAGTLKEGIYAATDTFRSATSFKQWMQGGAALATSGVGALAHGLNAFIALDKAYNGALGLHNFPVVADAAKIITKLASGLENGSLPQVVFSGAKLCALVALSGNPNAKAVIAMAESMYERYAKQPTA